MIPFTPLAKPLSECRVALVSTAGVARNDDRPFDQEGERRNPWWGDPSYRAIPLGTTEKDVRLYHLHIDPRFGESDLDVVLPMRRLTELSRAGLVGSPALTHYSVMGYILDETDWSRRPHQPLPSACAPMASTPPRWCPRDRSAAGPWDWSNECSRRAASRPWRCR